MFHHLLLLFFVLFSTFQSTSSARFYGVDFSVPTTLTQLQCIQNASYYRLVPRVFHGGDVDLNGITTLKMLRENGILINYSGYITPDPMGDGQGQINKLYNSLISNDVWVRTYYLQITKDSAPWPTNTTANINLISSMITRASQCGIILIIQSSLNDWAVITGNYKDQFAHIGLWYTHVYSAGVTGESSQNYGDFVAFGPWSKNSVVMKQFAIGETVCGVDVNRDVYYTD